MYPSSFQKLIDHFNSLPGIGPKMAERLVLHLYKNSSDRIDDFARDLLRIKDITSCKTCFNIAESDQCKICADSSRDHTQLCIVEESLDILPIERSRAYNGMYHVLGGTIKKQDTHHLSIEPLLKRVLQNGFTEIIIATNFTTEGDLTAMYLQDMFVRANKDIHISRLVRGLATGSDIEYADDMTIRSAINNREKIS